MQVCAFPTSLVFVDDDVQYIESVSALLRGDNFLRWHVPGEDVDSFLVKRAPYLNKEKVGIKRKISDFSDLSISCDIRELHKMIYNENRFSIVSAIIVDQVMPDLYGTKILKRLKEFPFKKAVLTGFIKGEKAINLCNSDTVDMLINKGDENFDLTFKSKVNSLVSRFFNQTFSYNYFSHDFLENPFLLKLITDLIASEKPVEYYILDDGGSCLFLDGKATPSCLLVYEGQDMENLIKFLLEESVPQEQYSGLINKTHVVGMYYKNMHGVDVNTLLNSLVPAKIMTKPSGENIYYAFVKGPNVFSMDSEKVISFVDFKKKNSLIS